MNYLAHAYLHLDNPFFAAGTALPDWMSVIDRKNRARRQFAEPIVADDDAEISQFARGVVQHHIDDHWFHGNEAFLQLSMSFAVELRNHLGSDLGHQAGFVGHIAVELLLDAALIERQPELVDRYYEMLRSLDHRKLQDAANKILPKPVSSLVILVPRFIDERFLSDYLDDLRLLRRLNGVMKRVRLPPLPDSLAGWLATARMRVERAADALLTPSDGE